MFFSLNTWLFLCAQLNPALLDGATDSKTNTETLLSLLNTMVEDIFRAVEFCPM